MELYSLMREAYWSPHVLLMKRNCVELKYYDDEYIKYFGPKTKQISFISIAVYLRVVGTRKIIERCFDCFKNERVQFVNLGSGLDTVSLWVLNMFPNAVCYDLDLEFQTKVKVDTLVNCKELLKLFPNYKNTESSFHSERYHIFPCDLRDVNQLDKLKELGFSDQYPSVYLSEFVLAYVENHLSNKVISYLSTLSKRSSFLVYHEWGKPTSYFMKWYYKEVCEKQNLPLYSLFEYPDVDSQTKRYKSLGWDEAYVKYLTFVYNHMIDKNERLRLRKIENFNDMKNLGIYCSHPFIGVCVKNCNNTDFVAFLEKPKSENKDKEDELVPHFEVEDLEKEFNLDPLIEYLNQCLYATLGSESEECNQFYKKFTC